MPQDDRDFLQLPTEYFKRRLVRFLQASLGFLAGVCLVIGGVLWGYWSDDSGLAGRLGVAGAAILGGAGIFLYIRKKAYE